ncbi:MAG: hypothetical protein V5A44_12435 [Haloarculaceae archaeon]
MQPSTRYAVALAVGLVAAAVTYVAAVPVVESSRVGFVTALTGLVWSVAVVMYLNVLCRLHSAERPSEDDASVAAKWGVLAGGVVSIGIAGTAVLLVELAAFRFVATVVLFVFGFGMASMSLGMGVVADRFDGAPSDAASGESPADGESALADD